MSVRGRFIYLPRADINRGLIHINPLSFRNARKSKRYKTHAWVSKLKIITINLSQPHVKALQVLQDLGLYPSRSEAIRVAIRDFLQRELGFAQRFDEMDAKAPQKIAPAPTAVDHKKEIARLLRKLREETPELSTVA